MLDATLSKTRVKRAADHPAAKRYITNEDRKALSAGAQQEPLPAC